MEGKRLLRSIRLDNVLSYGPNDSGLSLEPLNVLIGPNASGKSNLIEALSLLAAAPRDLQAPIRDGGGVREWLWKGASSTPTATVDVTVENTEGPMSLRYKLSFSEMGARFELRDEAVENENPTNPYDQEPYFYYRYQDGNPVLNVSGESRIERRLRREDIEPNKSILSQRRDPDNYPELTFLATNFQRMRLYRDFNVGRNSPLRRPQSSDLQHDVLLEDGSNLGVLLDDLLSQPLVKRTLIEKLKEFYTSIDDIGTKLSGPDLQIFFHEEGLQKEVSAIRLSDGSLRYLCLLALLCHPKPPPVLCLEEPEIGLHPDVIPEIAQLLVEASSRSQLFVTTHSDILVDALTDFPEAVLVCEKLDGATQLRRLDRDELEPWLEKYRLGELWTRGEIGGNRW